VLFHWNFHRHGCVWMRSLGTLRSLFQRNILQRKWQIRFSPSMKCMLSVHRQRRCSLKSHLDTWSSWSTFLFRFHIWEWYQRSWIHWYHHTIPSICRRPALTHVLRERMEVFRTMKLSCFPSWCSRFHLWTGSLQDFCQIRALCRPPKAVLIPCKCVRSAFR